MPDLTMLSAFDPRQLLDPRSQIVREVCNVTKSIADKMPEQFRAREIVGVLLKLTYVTIRAIAEPAAECLDSIVQGQSLLSSYTNPAGLAIIVVRGKELRACSSRSVTFHFLSFLQVVSKRDSLSRLGLMMKNSFAQCCPSRLSSQSLSSQCRMCTSRRA
jgi:hypothetical protein